MEPMDVDSGSAAARQRGNDFYRKGQFAQAEKAYKEAAELDPTDSAPWSNISAINFELGRYNAALKDLEKAIALLSSEPGESPKKQKLYNRMAKCHLHSLSLEKAQVAVDLLSSDASNVELRSSLKELQALHTVYPDKTAFQKEVLDRLPRFKATLLDCPEFYAIGHDTIDSLLDKSLKATMTPGQDLAFFFGGSGDARHVMITLAQAFAELGMMNPPGPRRKAGKVYFTLVDINAAAFARMLVVFDMLAGYGYMKLKKMPRIEDALTCIAYLYSSPFVPAFAVEKMMESVKTLIDILEKVAHLPGSTHYDLFYISKDTLQQILRKLKSWTELSEDKFPLPALRRSVMRERVMSNAKANADFGINAGQAHTYAPKSVAEVDAFGVVFAEKPFLQRRQPELIPLLDAWRAGRPGAKKALDEHIDAKWKLNPSVLDVDYEQQKVAHSKWLAGPSLEWNPVDVAKEIVTPLEPNPGNGAIEGLMKVFDIMSIGAMVKDVQIEVIHGEMAEVMERIQHGCLDHRKHKPGDKKDIDPTCFPRVYDRIHMSNIPDYIGGPLTAFMCGGPLLRNQSSNLKFNCLLNPPMFRDHDQFLAEYLLTYDSQKVADHFGMIRKPDPTLDPMTAARNAMMVESLGMGSFVVEDYFTWRPSGSKAISHASGMNRSTLELWLQAHLLKIRLPHQRPPQSDRPVYAPLNLTAFFRLVARMHEVGYQSHWLSAILASICEGHIKTKARAPGDIVMAKDEVAKAYTQRDISLGPWKAEFTTLLSLWCRLLPFGVVADGLVPLGQIVQCSLTFPNFPHDFGHTPHFALLFYNKDLRGSIHLQLSRILRDDEAGDNGDFAQRMRCGGLHVVTGTKYVTETRTATMWMRKDMVDEVTREDRWKVVVCRTDTYDIFDGSTSSPSKIMHILGSWNGS